jgi:hypothetical protein
MTIWLQKLYGEAKRDDAAYHGCAQLATFLSKLAIALLVGIVFGIFVIAD